MRMYLISDNTDTLTGMRLAGVDGVIANEKGTLEKALNEVLKDKNIGIILLTETLGKKYPELVKTVRTEHKKPLLIEIPDRHGTGRRPDFITTYVNDAIGLKLSYAHSGSVRRRQRSGTAADRYWNQGGGCFDNRRKVTAF